MAALVLSLVLGTAFIVVDRHEADALQRDIVPLTDEQAAQQVVGPGRQIVATAHLKDATAGYAFVSCVSDNDPPYQAVLHMSFRLPQGDWGRRLDEVASAMIADGWANAPATAERFGRKLTRDGVTAVLQRNVDDVGFATVRIYGECRNTTDHRNDSPAWTEVSL
ncbi:hypothetical protein BST47_24990 [Mycolicibacterium tusciae]|uniref:Lipoprotein LppJ n=2 Tax=Mycolicibacterium tusciae TaxID=75922 RepID=A0A1X0JH83_9MYCO|nr:hypothetical protein BST47_24990 [Mycolicibacterium tusciae]